MGKLQVLPPKGYIRLFEAFDRALGYLQNQSGAIRPIPGTPDYESFYAEFHDIQAQLSESMISDIILGRLRHVLISMDGSRHIIPEGVWADVGVPSLLVFHESIPDHCKALSHFAGSAICILDRDYKRWLNQEIRRRQLPKPNERSRHPNPQLSIEDLERLYQVRVAEWGDAPSPKSIEDWEFLKGHDIRVPRHVMEECRRKFAPKEWHKSGPKSHRSKAVINCNKKRNSGVNSGGTQGR